MTLWLSATAGAAPFDIPAGKAIDSIDLFTRQAAAAGLQITFAYDDVRSVAARTEALQGDFEPLEALSRMLKQLPITYEMVDADTLTLSVVKEISRSDEAKSPVTPLGAADQELIAEQCQFGRISALRAEHLLGIAPGYCWCCHAYDAAYRDYQLLRTQYQAKLEAYQRARPHTLMQRLVSLVKPRHPPIPPIEVPPPASLFCAAIATPERCSIFDGLNDADSMDAVVIRTKGTLR